MAPTVLWVSGTSTPSATAGAIAHRLRRYEGVRLRAIGVRAGYQALKAVALARRFLADEGYDLLMAPSFHREMVEGQERVVLEVVAYRVEVVADPDERLQ